MSKSISIKLSKYGLALGLVLIVVFLQVINPTVPLFSALNIKNIFLQSVSVALTALALSFIMISGEGDMSFAGMFSLLSTIFALMANRTQGTLLPFLVILAVSMLVYLGIAYLVTKFDFSSFIVSIAVMFMAIGIEKALHQQTTIVDDAVRGILEVNTGLPVIIWLLLVSYILAFIMVNKTNLGFRLRIIGENREAGIEAGINVDKMKFIAYALAAVLIACAASVESLRVGAIYQQGQNYMLPIFAACYLGSSMIVPGRVNIIGTFIGAIFMGVLGSFMKMISIESYIIPIVQGTVLIISVGFASFKNRDKIQQVKV